MYNTQEVGVAYNDVIALYTGKQIELTEENINEVY